MELSIVILNYNTCGLVKRSLLSFAQNTLPMSHEILVVNNSHDGCVDMVTHEFEGVKTMQLEKNFGYGGGNNIAIKHTKGKYILILNPDVTVSTDAITQLYTYIKAHATTAVVAPRLLNPDGSIQLSCLRFPSPLTPFYSRTFLRKIPAIKRRLERYRMTDFDHNTVRGVPWVLGACMLIRKSTFEQIGGFDKRYFMYFEDTDLCRTYWRQGYPVVYVPTAEMVHYYKRDSADDGFLSSISKKTFYYHISSWRKYVAKYKGQQEPDVKISVDSEG
jgi:GT2 family glycosyltransferase